MAGKVLSCKIWGLNSHRKIGYEYDITSLFDSQMSECLVCYVKNDIYEL